MLFISRCVILKDLFYVAAFPATFIMIYQKSSYTQKLPCCRSRAGSGSPLTAIYYEKKQSKKMY
jgi:hypothetical protein